MMRYRRRRNPDTDLSEVPVRDFRPSNPKEAAVVKDYGRKYTDWHWSLKPKWADISQGGDFWWEL